MSNTLKMCCLETKPRWIDTGASNDHRYNLMCSNCGEVIHKKIGTNTCKNCGCSMKQEVE